MQVFPPPPVLAETVRRELAGERVVWAASPAPWGYAANFWTQALIGVPFTAFAVFWTYNAVSIGRHVPSRPPGAGAGEMPGFFGHVPAFFVLWGCMFVGFGLATLLSPLYRAWLAKRMYYAVTERRAVIVARGWRTRIQSFDASALGRFERVSSGGAAGKIVFARVPGGSNWNWPRRGPAEVGFLGLADYAPAEQALRRLVSNPGNLPPR